MSRVAVATLLATVVVAAVTLRLSGLMHDAPYIYHPDEPLNISIALNIFRTGDLNPHHFYYPSTLYYVTASAVVPYYAYGTARGMFKTRADIAPLVGLGMGITKAPLPRIVLLQRLVSVAAGLAGIALLFWLAKLLTGNSATGVLASAMLAFSPTSVELNRYVTPDTLLLALALATCVACVFLYTEPRRRNYVIAGILAGLTAGTKYTGVLIVVSIVAAHVLRAGTLRSLRTRDLWLSFLCCAVTFVVTTPFAIFDAAQFVKDVAVVRNDYAKGHAGMEGNTLRWYLSYMLQTSGVIYILGAIEIARAVWRRDKRSILIAAFPVIYFGFVSSYEVRNDRTLLPITPFMFLLASMLMRRLWQYATSVADHVKRNVLRGAVMFAVLAAVGQPLYRSIIFVDQFGTIDNQEAARQWIANTLPKGSHIAIESYAPFVDPNDYIVSSFVRLIDHPAAWYAEHGYAYAVFSERMFGRFYLEPERYPEQILRYEALRKEWPLIKAFSQNGYRIRVHQIPPPSDNELSVP